MGLLLASARTSVMRTGGRAERSLRDLRAAILGFDQRFADFVRLRNRIQPFKPAAPRAATRQFQHGAQTAEAAGGLQ